MLACVTLPLMSSMIYFGRHRVRGRQRASGHLCLERTDIPASRFLVTCSLRVWITSRCHAVRMKRVALIASPGRLASWAYTSERDEWSRDFERLVRVEKTS